MTEMPKMLLMFILNSIYFVKVPKGAHGVKLKDIHNCFDYFNFFYVKHFELPLCMKYAI